MKWTIFGLVFVGLVAAFAATVLTAALRAEFGIGGTKTGTVSNELPTEVEVIVATRDLPAMSVIDSSSVATRTVMSDELPDGGALSSAVQAIGQILILPMAEGEPFTTRKIARAESRLHLASTLPQGGRAMSVVLSDGTRMEELLYPGCLVDVVASFRMPAVRGSPAGEIVSVTLLQGVQVLSVGSDSVIGDNRAPDAAPSQIDGRPRRTVTLLVNSDQGEALQLAAAHGDISLTLRNPLDPDPVASRGVLLSDLSEELAQRLAALGATPLPSEAMVPPEADRSPTGTPQVSSKVAATTSVEGEDDPVPALAPERSPGWKIVVLRGRVSEVQSFPAEETEEVQQP